MKYKPRTLIAILLVILLLLAGGEVARRIAARYVARQLVAELQRIYGGDVAIDRVGLGWDQTTLDGLRFYELNGKDRPPWMIIERAELDLGWPALLRGESLPQQLTAQRPAIVLRFDEDGQLITQIPLPEGDRIQLPQTIHLHDGQLTFHQPGRQETNIPGIQATLTSRAASSNVIGQVVEPTGNRWDFQSQVDRETWDTSGRLTTQRVSVQRAMLERLPLVDPQLWRLFQPTGETAAELTFRFDPEEGSFRYRAEFTPDAADIYLPVIDLKLERANGTLVFADGQAESFQLRGIAAGGEIHGQGRMGVEDQPWRMHLDVRFDQLALAQLPEGWGLPTEVTGLLSGQAELDVDLADEPIRIHGDGQGEITQAHLGGIAVDPITVELFTTQAEANPRPDSSYLRFNLNLRDADLHEVIQALPFDIEEMPFALAGRATLQGQITVPLDTVGATETYRFEGTLSLPRLTVEDLELAEVQANLRYAAGALHIEQLQTLVVPEEDAPPETAPGRVAGDMRLDSAPDGKITSQLTFEHVSLGRILGLFAGDRELAHGVVSGTLDLQVPLTRWQESTAWNLTGPVQSEGLVVGGVALRRAEADVRLREGVLLVADGRADWEGTDVAGSGSLQLAVPNAFSLEMQIADGDLAPIASRAELPVGWTIAGRYRAGGRIDGTLVPLRWETAGRGQAPHVLLGDLTLADARFTWQADQERLRLTDVFARVAGGEVSAELVLPTDSAQPSGAEGRFFNLDIAALTATRGETALPLEGRASGTFTVRGIEPDAPLDVQLQLRDSRLGWEGIVAEQLSGTLGYRGGELAYRLEGIALDGRMRLQGQADLRDEQARRLAGRLELDAARLASIWQVLGISRELLPLAGSMDLQLDFTQRPQGDLTGRGQVVFHRLRWDRFDLASRLQGTLSLSGSLLQLRGLAGRVGDGSVRGDVMIQLQDLDRSTFNLALERVPASTLMAAWPELATQIEGRVDARLRGRLGRQISGGGQVGMARARIGGVEVTSLRVPVEVAFAAGRGQIQNREGSAQLARGRAVGQVRMTFGRTLDLDGNLRVTDVDLQTLVRQAGQAGQAGSGRMSGQIRFAGRNVRSANDLTANFDARLTQSQALQFAVLRDVGRYLAAGQPALSTTFTTGQLRGSLARGVARIESLTLATENMQLLLEGTVTLQGRLNLDVVANTGQATIETTLLRLLRVPLLAAQPIPVALLTQVNQAMSNRLIYLRVTGTVRNPSIQLRPAPMLQQEALLFFLRQGEGLL